VNPPGVVVLAKVAATPPPDWLPPVARSSVVHGWEDIAANPRPFLDIGCVDAEIFPAVASHVWVTSQLRLRDRWLEMMRQKVLSGAMKLDAALAKMLGMEFPDSVAMKGPSESPATGPQAEYRRFQAMLH